jgi:hypothetical protein
VGFPEQTSALQPCHRVSYGRRADSKPRRLLDRRRANRCALANKKVNDTSEYLKVSFVQHNLSRCWFRTHVQSIRGRGNCQATHRGGYSRLSLTGQSMDNLVEYQESAVVENDPPRFDPSQPFADEVLNRR